MLRLGKHRPDILRVLQLGEHVPCEQLAPGSHKQLHNNTEEQAVSLGIPSASEHGQHLL